MVLLALLSIITTQVFSDFAWLCDTTGKLGGLVTV